MSTVTQPLSEVSHSSLRLKLLVIRFSSIGDIVLTTPVLRCLKKQLPAAEIHFLTKKKFSSVTAANPYVDRFIYFDDSLGEIQQQLKNEQYDYIIDLHRNIRTDLLKLTLRRKSTILSYRKESFGKFLLTKFGINVMTGKHIVLRNLETVKPLGVKDDGMGLDYFIAPEDEVSYHDLPTSHVAGYVAIVIGASYATKKLPVYKLQELCRGINHPVMLIGGKEDFEEGAEIAATDEHKIYNACGKFSLNQSADLVRKSRLVISHDTGLQYIACAFYKPVIAVWGGTSPKLDVEPYYGTQYKSKRADGFTYSNMLVKGVKCQPCSNFGTKECPLGHFKCMRQQDIETIVQLVTKLLKEK